MSVEFICSDCKGDGTRCDCHKKRNYYKPYKFEPTIEQRESIVKVAISILSKDNITEDDKKWLNKYLDE